MKINMKRLLKVASIFGVFLCLLYLVISSNTDEKCEKNSGVACEEEVGEESMAKYSAIRSETEEQQHISTADYVAREETDVKPLTTVHLSVVACGDRLEETLTMIKSAIIFSKAPIHVYIFADEDLQAGFVKQLDEWATKVYSKLTYTIHAIQFPTGHDEKVWRQLFKPCASQRLFIPTLLKDVTAMLYVDTDILFLRPIEDVWNFFKELNSSHIAAMAPEHEEPSASWYKRFSRHPYVPPYGINSGVMLMNLTLMRAVDWLTDIIEYYKNYHYNITWGDQDLINIYFHFYPERLYQFACDWNYRPDHCMYMSNCKHAEQNGVSVVHGCRSVFHNEKQPVFKAIYETLRDYQFGDDLKTFLFDKMAENIKSSQPSQCGRVGHIFTKQFERQIVP